MLFFLDGHRPDWNVFRCTEHAWLTSKYIVSFLSFHFGVFVFNMTLNCRSIEQKKEKKNNYAVFWLCVITWMSKTNYSRCTNAICCLAKLRKKEINVYSWKENYCFILCYGIVKGKKVKKKPNPWASAHEVFECLNVVVFYCIVICLFIIYGC